MVVFWSWGRSRDNYGVVDVGWGVVIMGILWVYFLKSFGTQIISNISSIGLGVLLLMGMISIWGLRLAIFLWWTRIRTGHAEDKRYNAFRADYGDKVHQKFFTNVFLFQGLLALILTAPFLPIFVESVGEPGIFAWVGLALYIIGQIGETISDNQLSGFIKNPSNKGQVCNVGFWKYSRHPNYFFEWVIWLGMSLVVAEVSIVGILPAIFMYVLLVYVTGVPIAEKYSLLSKGDKFREYQRTTNAFFPWFPKK
ncbi:MAG: DUF1295 domain-containing protein [Leptospira sp.]|nr:DUF1295 domain-containing protein [Leptospira sp.]